MANINKNLTDFDDALDTLLDSMKRFQDDTPEELVDNIENLETEYNTYLRPDIETLIDKNESLEADNQNLRDENEQLLNQTE